MSLDLDKLLQWWNLNKANYYKSGLLSERYVGCERFDA